MCCDEKGRFHRRIYQWEGGKRHVKVDKFLQHWTGTVLLGEPTEATPNEQFYIMRNIVFYLLRYRFIIALLFVLILGLQTAFCQSRSLALCSIYLYCFLNTRICRHPLQRAGERGIHGAIL